MTAAYPRDLLGYGRRPPHPRWPGAARLAVQFVLNFEEGAENCVLDGDPASEVFLSEIINAQAFPMRHMSMESLYEYGSRAGIWRVLRAFERHRLPLTVFAVAVAVQRHPEAAAAFRELGHEIACHGLRWISYQQVAEATERAHMAQAVAILEETFGAAPLGWYTGRDSPQTRRLVVEHGGFLYDSDSYADDLPYWTVVSTGDGTSGGASVGGAGEGGVSGCGSSGGGVKGGGASERGASGSGGGTSSISGGDGNVAGRGADGTKFTGTGLRDVPHLVIPYTLDTNDMRFATAQGFNSGTQFFDYLKAAFDTLYREGDPNGLDAPKMLSIGLHCRLAGRPGRIAALEQFLEYVLQHEQVWICRRIDIARHWLATHPYREPA
jgi:peptidoglycan/xylan/chitin deacetylase (PgdA/CDA1 family)